MQGNFCNGIVYAIRKGDTLYQISRRFRVPLALILRANPYVDIYNLQVGQEICIPVRRPQGNMDMRPPGACCDLETREERLSAEPEFDLKEEADEESMGAQNIEDSKQVYITEGETSLGNVLSENDLTMEEFLKTNDINQIQLAKDVVLYLPKKS